MRSSRIDTSFGSVSQVIFLLLLLVSLTLSGCGGGGGGVSTPATQDEPPPQVQRPPPTQVTCVSTSEGCLTATQYRARIQSIKTTHTNNAGFTNQWGLKQVKADEAWAKLQLKHGVGTAPGDGVTLGVVDSGIDKNHQVFSGKTVIETFLQGATNEDGSVASHGTAVASVMAANPSQSFITQETGARGVAWGADITMFAIPVSTRRAISLSSLKHWDHPTRWPAIINEATRWSNNGRTLDFVNASLGIRLIIDMYSKSVLTSNFGNFINAIKQSGSSSKTVFVWAAGNFNGTSCNRNQFPASHRDLCVNGKFNAMSPVVMAGLPARFPELTDL